MSSNLRGQSTRQKWLLLIALPLAFLFKDVIATVAILSTEPGITAQAATYYHLALLPGTLFLNAGGAILLNLFVGFVVGCFLCGRLYSKVA